MVYHTSFVIYLGSVYLVSSGSFEPIPSGPLGTPPERASDTRHRKRHFVYSNLIFIPFFFFNLGQTALSVQCVLELGVCLVELLQTVVR